MRGVFVMNEVLLINNLLRNFEAMLGEFGLIERYVLSSPELADIPTFTCIYGIIVLYLSNTIEITEALKMCVTPRAAAASMATEQGRRRRRHQYGPAV